MTLGVVGQGRDGRGGADRARGHGVGVGDREGPVVLGDLHPRARVDGDLGRLDGGVDLLLGVVVAQIGPLDIHEFRGHLAVLSEDDGLAGPRALFRLHNAIDIHIGTESNGHGITDLGMASGI